MDYVTASELSQKWNISTRRIASYCETGRIEGVVKKGRVWLIPADAQRPIDKRKATRNILVVDDNIADKEVLAVINKVQATHISEAVYPEVIYKHLGLTRDTLRYYEKIGLIEPKRKVENFYREFDNKDVYQLKTIDFYKKCGFTVSEIKNLLSQPNLANTLASFEQKAIELEKSIYNQQRILTHLKETKKSCENMRPIGEKFEIKDFPLYSVLKSFDDTRDISNFGDTIFSELDGESLLSHLIQAVSLDDTGYKGTKTCIVKKVTGEDSQGLFLESGRCGYTAGLVEEGFEEKIFFAAHKWANEHGVEHKGISYFINRFRLQEENKTYQFSELWIPIK